MLVIKVFEIEFVCGETNAELKVYRMGLSPLPHHQLNRAIHRLSGHSRDRAYRIALHTPWLGYQKARIAGSKGTGITGGTVVSIIARDSRKTEVRAGIPLTTVLGAGVPIIATIGRTRDAIALGAQGHSGTPPADPTHGPVLNQGGCAPHTHLAKRFHAGASTFTKGVHRMLYTAFQGVTDILSTGHSIVAGNGLPAMASALLARIIKAAGVSIVAGGHHGVVLTRPRHARVCRARISVLTLPLGTPFRFLAAGSVAPISGNEVSVIALFPALDMPCPIPAVRRLARHTTFCCITRFETVAGIAITTLHPGTC